MGKPCLMSLPCVNARQASGGGCLTHILGPESTSKFHTEAGWQCRFVPSVDVTGASNGLLDLSPFRRFPVSSPGGS